MSITYKTGSITADEFIDILERSTLYERRPVANREVIEGMVKNADITITAYDGDTIVGVARAVTDFHYACYLSDLAVDEAYQRQGIGHQLIAEIEKQVAKECKIVLLSAPKATGYYPKIGFIQHPSAWIKAQ